MPGPDPAAIAQAPGGSLGPDPPREGEPGLLLTQPTSLKRQEVAWAPIPCGKERHMAPLNPHKSPPHFVPSHSLILNESPFAVLSIIKAFYELQHQKDKGKEAEAQTEAK
ncbi:hypothetical protein H920_08725 [Fukomys damarensis]|uniref:Uncharacterized protein n=1 Tax=Fukomys damarensis TaxID=885580 RepID=A0A091DHB6_FUKDA|nr:hypothetical protein H920_08725 [Fukomys damarensis]